MIGAFVSHNQFGRGKIVDAYDIYVKVAFETNELTKVFLYPKAFEQFLAFEDNGLQNKASELIAEVKEKEANEKRLKQLAFEAQERERIEKELEASKRRRRTTKVKA